MSSKIMYIEEAKSQYPEFDFTGWVLETMTIKIEEPDFERYDRMAKDYDFWPEMSLYDMPVASATFPDGYTGLFFAKDGERKFFLIKTN